MEEEREIEYWKTAWTPTSDSNLKGWVHSMTDVEDFMKLYESAKGRFIGDRKSANFGLHEVANDASISLSISSGGGVSCLIAAAETTEIEAAIASLPAGGPGEQSGAEPPPIAADIEINATVDPQTEKSVIAVCTDHNFYRNPPKWVVRPQIQLTPRKNAGKTGSEVRTLDSFVVRFSDVSDSGAVTYDGVPFVVVGSYTLHCQYGRNKNLCAQLREKAIKEEELKTGQPRVKRRKRAETKKTGCPARVIMKEVIRFPQFHASDEKKFSREKTSRDVRWAIKSKSDLVTEHRIYIALPRDEDHNSTHPVGTPITIKSKRVRSRMQAVQQTGSGGPEVLGVFQAPVPTPGPNEVLMKIHASAINRADTLQRRGLYPVPAGSTPIFGLEAAGEVWSFSKPKTENKEERKWKKGDKVMALLPGGGNAQYAKVHEDHLMPVPDHLTTIQAAAIPEVWLTAFQLLYFVASMKRGDVVLIHAGGSGVGTAATQIVRHFGGIPIVTAGTEAKLEKAKSLGAAAAFNYKEVDFADEILEVTQGKGVNIILDCIGGSYWEKNLKVIAVEGTWVVYGLMGGKNIEGPALGDILRKRVNIHGTTLRPRSDEYKSELIRVFSENILPHFTPESPDEPPALVPIIDRVFSLEEISDAHRYMDENKTIGKVLLTVSHSVLKTEL